MFEPINNILNQLNINFDEIFKNLEIQKTFINLLNEYYKIKIEEDFTNLDQLENIIFKLVNSYPIMFHHFHNKDFPEYSMGSITDIELENMINLIGRENILDIDIWIKKYCNGSLKKGETCFTLDDGLKCQYEVALPIFKKYNIKTLWFIYTSPLTNTPEMLEIYKYFCGNYYNNYDEFYNEVFELFFNNNIILKNLKIKKEDICSVNNFNKDNPYRKDVSFYTFNDRKFRYIRDKILSKEQFNNLILELINLKIDEDDVINKFLNKIWISKDELIKLNETHQIGIHSHTHPTAMEDKNYNEQFYEYKKSKDLLEDILGEELTTLSFPCGKFNNDTLDILKKLKIKYSFNATLKLPNFQDKNYFIQRMDHILVKKIN